MIVQCGHGVGGKQVIANFLAQAGKEQFNFLVLKFNNLLLDFSLFLEVILIARRILQRLKQRQFPRLFAARQHAVQSVVVLR